MNLNEELAAKDSLITAQSARIAELEAQIAAASGQKPEHVAYAENGVLHWMTGRKFQNCELYTAPQAADTDKLREAIAGISNNQITEAWESCGGVDGFYKSFGYQQFAHAILNLAADTVASTALQAPVREVPEVNDAKYSEAEKAIGKIIFERYPRIKGVHCASITTGILEYMGLRHSALNYDQQENVDE